MRGLFLFILIVTYQPKEVIVIECKEVNNTRRDNCVAEHGRKITSVLLENICEDTVYLSTDNSGALKIVAIKLFLSNGLENRVSGDYFGPNKYSGVIPPCSKREFFICDTVPQNGYRREYEIEYKVKDRFETIWAAPNLK